MTVISFVLLLCLGVWILPLGQSLSVVVWTFQGAAGSLNWPFCLILVMFHNILYLLFAQTHLCFSIFFKNNTSGYSMTEFCTLTRLIEIYDHYSKDKFAVPFSLFFHNIDLSTFQISFALYILYSEYFAKVKYEMRKSFILQVIKVLNKTIHRSWINIENGFIF